MVKGDEKCQKLFLVAYLVQKPKVMVVEKEFKPMYSTHSDNTKCLVFTEHSDVQCLNGNKSNKVRKSSHLNSVIYL